MNDEWRDEVSLIRQYSDDHVCNICYVCKLSSMFNVHTNSISTWFRQACELCPKKYNAGEKFEIVMGT